MKIIETIKLDNRQSQTLLIYGTILSIVAVYAFLTAFEWMTGRRAVVPFDASLIITALLAILPTVIIHELLHGIGFLLAGGKMSFGVRMAGYMPVAYASTHSTKISARHMFADAYIPFVVLSVIYMVSAFMFPELYLLFLIGFVANFAGAVGDIWLSMRLWKYLGATNVYAEALSGGGLIVYQKGESSTINNSKKSKKHMTYDQVAKVVAASWVMVYAAQAIAPDLIMKLGAMSSYELGFSGLYLLKFSSIDGKIKDESSFVATIAVALFVGLIYYVVIHSKQQNQAHRTSK
jgi:hypothetical protein